MAHPIIFNNGLGLGIMLLGFGLNATLRPKAHLGSLGFLLHDEPTAQKLDHALMQIWDAHNITVGLLITFIWISGDEKLMGMGLGASIVMPMADGFVSRFLIGGGEGQH
jgi:hypothetical protein